MVTQSPLLELQRKAWGYYGFASNNVQQAVGACVRPVGEIRYVVGWMADQMSRMNWVVTIDGKTDWSAKLPSSGATVSSKANLEIASAELLREIGWNENTVRQITANLFVAGQADYVTTDKQSGWEVVSVIRPDREKIVKSAKLKVPILWPHPADPTQPDAPLFGVITILDELAWLSALLESQAASRISMRGIIGVADGLEFANGADLWDEFQEAIQTRMDDPTDVSPLLLRGPAELIQPQGTGGVGGGMKGLSWVIPDFPYDNRIDNQVRSLIQRLSYGLPIPPEILLGMQAQSKATAFQVEENSYRAHIEPPAFIVAHVAQEALSKILPDKKVEVIPDPTDLLARRHSTQDVITAWDRGLVTAKFVRKILNIPEEEAATPDDLNVIAQVNDATPADENLDPGNRAAKPTVGSMTTESNTHARLLTELSGAAHQAADRAREKIGARARSNSALRAAIKDNVPNNEVAAELGPDVLRESGMAVDEIVMGSLTPLLLWWESRLEEAGETHDFASASTSALADVLATHIIDNLHEYVNFPVDGDLLLSVLQR